MTKSLAVAWAPHSIRVNAIGPGYVRTKFSQFAQDEPDIKANVLRRTPMKRWGEPEEIAGGAVYLASPAATFVTGTTLIIDGGYMAV